MTSSPLSTDLPAFADVEDAARQISGEAIRTPLLESALLNEEAGRRLLVKPECLQRTGSFKFRGAHNRISRMSADERARGVIAFSSGNHAQGVAHAARICGIAATIIMPEDAPKLKLANTRAYGAEVVTYDRFGESREEIGSEIAERTGAVLVKPYDDFHVIAGQGTCGLEIAEQCAEREIVPDAVVVCCGGGGLTSGISWRSRRDCRTPGFTPRSRNNTMTGACPWKREKGSLSIPDSSRSVTPSSRQCPVP